MVNVVIARKEIKSGFLHLEGYGCHMSNGFLGVPIGHGGKMWRCLERLIVSHHLAQAEFVECCANHLLSKVLQTWARPLRAL